MFGGESRQMRDSLEFPTFTKICRKAENRGMRLRSLCLIGDQPYSGSRGLAGEVGHLVVEAEGERCVCGNVGCLETVVSRPSFSDGSSSGCPTGSFPVSSTSGGKGRLDTGRNPRGRAFRRPACPADSLRDRDLPGRGVQQDCRVLQSSPACHWRSCGQARGVSP